MESILIIAILAYFLPFIIALLRGHGSKWAILVVNLLFGLTVFGWLFAFIWSLTSTNKQGNITIVNSNKG